MRHDVFRLLTIAVLSAVLTGCAGGPSEAEMRDAMLVAFGPMVGKDAEMATFEAGDCTTVENAYRCKVRGTLAYTLDLGGRTQDKTQPFHGTYNFIETEDGWRMLR